MQSGVLNKDNLSNVFRGLSQRRQQGTMEVTLPDSVMKISFVQGKIVDVTDSSGSSCAEVASLLVEAERLPAGWHSGAERYGELFAAASEAGGEMLTELVFKQAVKKRVLDKMYTLQLGSGAYYTFKVEMVDYDRDFSPHVSIGQLLLDYVALETDGPQFAELFPADKLVRRGTAPKSGLSEEEESVYDLLGEEGLSLADIARLSLLSRYHIQDSLLSLHKSGLVEVGGAATRLTAGDSLPGDIEGSIDAIFEAETGMAVSGPPHSSGSVAEPSTAGSEKETSELRAVAQPAPVPSAPSVDLLRSGWIPLGLLVVSLIAVIAIPLLRWGGIFEHFSQG